MPEDAWYDIALKVNQILVRSDKSVFLTQPTKLTQSRRGGTKPAKPT
jgi:hypothetical protein